MGSNGNEFKEEMNNVRKMSAYQKLAYIHKLSEFHLTFLDLADLDYIREYLKELITITKGYKSA